jgi:dGTPase
MSATTVESQSIYSRLLIADRLRPSSRGSLDILEEAESDRARVLYSSAFRRLQGKAQVFPLDDNAAVRTRLSHSLEVAHVGRYLAATVLSEFRKKGKDKQMGLWTNAR